MLKLTATHADAWNTAWFGPVDGIMETRKALEIACAEVGRDPATIDVTVGVDVSYPMLGMEPSREIDPARTLTGTPEEVAAGLRDYKNAGVSHVICAALADSTYDYAFFALGRLSEALKIYRSES